jgi:hypothetical protein
MGSPPAWRLEVTIPEGILSAPAWRLEMMISEGILSGI